MTWNHTLRLTVVALAFVSIAGASGCSGDDAPSTMIDASVRLDGGGTDAPPPVDAPTADTAAPDAPTGDAGTDAGPPQDGSTCETCFPASYAYGVTGGRTPLRNRSQIDPCVEFVHTRMNFSTGATMMCSNDVPTCATSDVVDAEDVNAAFAHPDVVTAFGDAPILYGIDSRPVDGQVFEIEEVGGETVTIGSPCSTPAGCIAIPPGVAALRDLLERLEMERVADTGCSEVFPSP